MTTMSENDPFMSAFFSDIDGDLSPGMELRGPWRQQAMDCDVVHVFGGLLPGLVGIETDCIDGSAGTVERAIGAVEAHVGGFHQVVPLDAGRRYRMTFRAGSFGGDVLIATKQGPLSEVLAVAHQQ
jgi:hypothetical protein